MSDEEKFEAQGRAYKALKVAKSNVATLTVSLREYGQTIGLVRRAIDEFLTDPAQRDRQAVRPFADVQEQLRQLNTEAAILQIEELHAEATKVHLLQEQIEKF